MVFKKILAIRYILATLRFPNNLKEETYHPKTNLITLYNLSLSSKR